MKYFFGNVNVVIITLVFLLLLLLLVFLLLSLLLVFLLFLLLLAFSLLFFVVITGAIVTYTVIFYASLLHFNTSVALKPTQHNSSIVLRSKPSLWDQGELKTYKDTHHIELFQYCLMFQ